MQQFVSLRCWWLHRSGRIRAQPLNTASADCGFFLLGLVPMYAYHRAARWHLRRRVAALEAAARVPVAVAPVINPPPAEPAPEPTPEPAPTPSADLPPPESADQPTEQEPPTP